MIESELDESMESDGRPEFGAFVSVRVVTVSDVRLRCAALDCHPSTGKSRAYTN